MSRAQNPRLHSDDGGVVIGWLTRVVVTFAIIGVVLFDAISIGTTSTSIADQGSTAAQEASGVWNNTHDIQQAYDAAVASAGAADARNEVSTTRFTVDPDGTVHLVIKRTAPTLVVQRWSRTAGWARVHSSAEGKSID